MDWKKIGAVAGAVAIAGAGFLGGLAVSEPVIVKEPTPFVITETVEKEVIVEVPVDKIIEVEKIVEVEDEEFLKLACDRLMYDDIQECKDEVQAEDEALVRALELINDEAYLFDFLEDEGFINDEDEAKLLKVYSDFDEVVIKDSDFDDKEYTFDIKVRVEDEDDDVKKKLWLTVKVEEDEVQIVSALEE